ncbi:MAG: hypothetical protein U5M51_14095 [Emticicia sp.]|nr:hypothetical protein [Emticicia sp.]
MKKTFLSLAFVLSISLAFGAESKPVVGKSKSGDGRVIAQNTPEKADEVSKKTIKVVSITDCFVVSCGVSCFTHETPLTTEQSLHIWQNLYQDTCSGGQGGRQPKR